MVNISVIIPTYKRIRQTIKTIKLILESERIGDMFNIELIVADSSPDDKLKTILKQRFKNQIIYTKPAKSGIAANKNHGARQARYPILIFCDSDIEVEPKTILNTIQALYRHKTAAAIGGQVIWRGGDLDTKLDRPRPEDRQIKIRQTTYVEALYSRYIATYKQVFWKVGGYDSQIFNMRGEGSDLSIRYWRAGFPLVYDPLIIVHHLYNAPNSAAIRLRHPEWGIAKDMLILGYKYGFYNGDKQNFSRTVAANFDKFGSRGYYNIIRGIAQNLDFIVQVKPKLDRQRKNIKSRYDFKFLDVFSNQELFQHCIRASKRLLLKVREKSLNA